jgi:hypothetical protein
VRRTGAIAFITRVASPLRSALFVPKNVSEPTRRTVSPRASVANCTSALSPDPSRFAAMAALIAVRSSSSLFASASDVSAPSPVSASPDAAASAMSLSSPTE